MRADSPPAAGLPSLRGPRSQISAGRGAGWAVRTLEVSGILVFGGSGTLRPCLLRSGVSVSCGAP